MNPKNSLKLSGYMAAALFLVSSALAAENPAVSLKAGGRLRLLGDSTLHPYASTATIMNISAELEPDSGLSLSEAVRTLKVLKFELAIPVKGLRSGESGLDKNLYAALKENKSPVIDFKLSKYQVFSDPAESQSTLIKAVGQLTIAGVSRAVELEAKGRLSEHEAVFAGNKKLLMSDFGVKPPTLMFGMIKVRDPIVVEFEISLQLESK